MEFSYSVILTNVHYRQMIYASTYFGKDNIDDYALAKKCVYFRAL
jgi:hypothetical protein